MITYTALCPHPPVMVPEIGQGRLKSIKATVEGMRELAREIAGSMPEVLVFLTPHGNVFSDCLSCLGEPILRGSLSQFGYNQWTSRENALELLKEVQVRCDETGIPFLILDRETAGRHHLNPDLDHGILVPLYYLQEAGLDHTPVLAVSTGFLPLKKLYTFGTILQAAAEKLGKKIAVIASGDMSHRLLDEGPYDFHPAGPQFDQAIKNYLQAGDILSILDLSEQLINDAGECGYRSIVIMLGTMDGWSFRPRVFSYEGPFGVGYLTAGLVPLQKGDSLLQQLSVREQQEQAKRRSQESPPVKWARLTLEQYVKAGKKAKLPAELRQLRESQAGVFVSLKKNGQLRGCIGTIIPSYGDMAEEIASNAISAGTQDPRFPPVEKEELEELVYSVDILSQPEPCSKEQLDPRRYGVIVSRGSRRGLLLPDLEGIDTVEEQIAIALQKAGIAPHQDFKIERFEVKRHL